MTPPVSSTPIDCAGDILTFECDVSASSSANFFLIWQVTVPGEMPVNFTYDSSSSGIVNSTIDLGLNISTTLIDYVPDVLLRSTLTLTVLSSMDRNGTLVQCLTEESILYLDTSGKKC